MGNAKDGNRPGAAVRAWTAAGVAATLLLAVVRAGAERAEGPSLDARRVGSAAEALRLPERAFPSQNSRGWQFRSLPPDPAGESGVLAASDGVYWNPEVRVLVKREGEDLPFVGLVFRYDSERSYGALLWNTESGALTLRSLVDGRPKEIARGKAPFGSRPWASVVLRAVMGNVAAYINGEKALAGSEPSLLGRVAVFAVGKRAPQLDGVEVHSLPAQQADADLFGRSRREYESLCVSCHNLDGPWNSNYAPDDWESVVREMRFSEGADAFISPEEAGRITDYLRLIALHPDREHYRPKGKDAHETDHP